MERDSRSNRLLESQLELHGIPWLSVDGALSIDETVERVNLHFQGGHMDA